MLSSLFGRFDIYKGNKSPYWHWNTFNRTSLSCLKFPIDAELLGKSKVPWTLCAHSAVYGSGCFDAAAGFAFVDQSELGQYHISTISPLRAKFKAIMIVLFSIVNQNLRFSDSKRQVNITGKP